MNRGYFLHKVTLSRLILILTGFCLILSAQQLSAAIESNADYFRSPPTFTGCPGTQNRTTDGCSMPVFWTPPIAVELDLGEAPVTVTSTHNPNDIFQVGITVVTYTATNNIGETATCSFEVRIKSNNVFDPSTIPSDRTSSMNAACDSRVLWFEPSLNCSGLTVVSTHTSGESFEVGATTTVTYFAFDGALIVGSCSFDVTIDDSLPPNFTNCPSDFTVAANNDCQAVVNWTAPTATDNCSGSITPVASRTPGSLFPFGATLVTYTATDASGNETLCTFTVTVEDQTAPVYTNLPENIVVSANANNCKAMVSWPTVIAEDNCNGAVTINQTHTPGSNFEIGINSVVYTATDAAGNSNIKSFTVTVVDDIPPTVSNCPATINVNANSSCGAVATWNAPSFDDKCDANLTVTSSHNSGDLFDLGTTAVLYTATDDGGNETTCTFNVIVSDATAPVFVTCPNDMTVSTTANCTGIATWTTPILSDNCDAAPLLTSNFNTGETFPLGQTIVEYTARDEAGNVANCSFTITVVDNTVPVFTACPTTINLAANGNCVAIANWTAPTVADNCTNSLSISESHSSGAAFPIGITTVSYSSTDQAGNTGTCSFEIIVSDITAPVFSNCPSAITLVADNNCGAVATWNEPNLSDNCSNAPEINQTATSGSRFPLGTTTVTYTAIDDFGNESSCAFTVTVIDDTAPSVNNCPNEINLSVGANSCSVNPSWTIPSFTDNCTSPLTITSTHSPGDQFFIGTTTVIYTAEDAAGNATTCSFDVIVTDGIAPIFNSCPGNINLTAASGCEAVATWNAPEVSDNCTAEITINASHNIGDAFPVGMTTVTYTAIDESGNQSSCSFTINVRDLSAPTVLSCPNDLVLTANENCQAVGEWTVPEFEDCTNLSISSNFVVGDVFEIGTSTVTYVATDANGRQAICSFTVTVLDEMAPVINNCLNDQTVYVNESCTASVNWEAPQALDNCDVEPSVSSNYQAGDVFEIGTTEVTYLFTDEAGNTASCSFNVIVIDESFFEIENCPEDILIETDDTGEAIVNWTPPTYKSNNCVAVTSTSNYLPGDTFEEGESTVTYEFTDENGRVRTCSFMVDVRIRALAIQAADLMSPNNDGINDTWIIEGLQNFPENQVTVVDRWGGLIFSATGYDNQTVVWDGTNRKGELVAKGTYFYAISVKTEADSQEKKGFIEIVH